MEYVSVQGEEVPKLGLGTWRLTGEDCRRAVGTALDLGYRHLDTAQAYGNERQVGVALADSDVDREEVFLTTKLDGSHREFGAVLDGVEESLERLETDYLDLLLIHWPNGRGLPGATPVEETLAAMNELVDDDRVRHIGVSNFGVGALDDARQASEAPIFTNQVQFHPFWDQTALLDYCAIHDVLLTAYSPLAHGGALGDATLNQVGDRYGKSAAQVALRWVLQHDQVATIPKATSRDHLEANLDIFDFELTDEEMGAIARPSKLRSVGMFARSRLPL
jgi:diketogulonate reductase-like aldo/keto reductase